MAKLWCRCGYLMSTSSQSNNVELNAFTARGFQSVIDGDMDSILQDLISLWWCPNCQRIHFHRPGAPTRVWALEEKAPPDAETADEYTRIEREFPDEE